MCVARGLGVRWGSEILMENKTEHHVPWVLTHSALLMENKHHRKRSQQEDTTELPVSASLTIMPSRLLALWRGQTTEPSNKTAREVPHQPLFLAIHYTPDTCKQKGQLLWGWLPWALAISEGWTLSLASPPSTGPTKKTWHPVSLMTSLYLFPSTQWNLF